MQPNSTRSIHPMIPVLCMLLAVFVWQAGANNASNARPPAQPTAVATVDIVTIFDQLDELKSLETELENRKNSRQAQLDEVKNQLRTISADLETLKNGTDEYKEKVREAMEMQAVIQARGEALNQILSIDRGAMTRDLYTKVSDAVNRIAEREGYDIVLFDDSTFTVPENAPYQDVFRSIITKSVLYRHDGVDITSQVVSLLNSEFSAP